MQNLPIERRRRLAAAEALGLVMKELGLNQSQFHAHLIRRGFKLGASAINRMYKMTANLHPGIAIFLEKEFPHLDIRAVDISRVDELNLSLYLYLNPSKYGEPNA